MGSPAVHGLLSLEEYLELERDSPVRHEYVGGVIYAMAGASRRHNRISGNIFRRLADAADGAHCRVYISDMKVLTPDGLGYYPDVMVACGREPEDPYLEDEPCLIVEVSSPSTAPTDRREKLLAYRNIPTLGAYLIVDQERWRVERHFRDDNGVWQRAGPVEDGRIPVPCPPGAELTLEGIYEGL
jgi:Uma2 family endonuclease